jgi:6,7-dimethyl-8-ribityllumazine synthase
VTTTYVGRTNGTGMRIAIACARFNGLVTERLLSGALDALSRHGVDDGSISVVWAPGGFELPFLAQHLAGAGEYDAVICLGAVIRGETGHYDQVANHAASGILRAGMDTRVPVIFGVLTTDTLEQALERAGAKAGNKGADAAVSAVEMVDLLRQLPKDTA